MQLYAPCVLRATGGLIGDLCRESDDLSPLDRLTMWTLAFNRLWRSSSLSFLLGRTLDRTSAIKIVDCIHGSPCTSYP